MILAWIKETKQNLQILMMLLLLTDFIQLFNQFIVYTEPNQVKNLKKQIKLLCEKKFIC